MLLLAATSVALLAWITFWDVPPEVERRVILADYLVCAIFAVEFGLRWIRAGGWTFPFRYWYEVLGMIPISHPFFRSFRLLRIVAVLARLGRVADRALGDRVTEAVVRRFSDTIVSVIRRPVTVAVMDEVTAVLAAGAHSRNVATALDRNREELDEMIVELVRADPAIGRLRHLPFHAELVRTVSGVVFRMIFQALHDPRTHALIGDVIHESAGQMRREVRTGDYESARAGVRAPQRSAGDS